MTTNRLRTAAFALAASIPIAFLGSGVAGATDYGTPPGYGGGTEGCTPGYWKNHLAAWDAYSPSTPLSSVFNISGPLSSATLQQGLSFQGGPGVTGAQQILLRAAVAALLNSVDSDVDYSLTTQQVINRVNNALASNDRQTMLTLASDLDTRNNGGCPL